MARCNRSVLKEWLLSQLRPNLGEGRPARLRGPWPRAGLLSTAGIFEFEDNSTSGSGLSFMGRAQGYGVLDCKFGLSFQPAGFRTQDLC